MKSHISFCYFIHIGLSCCLSTLEWTIFPYLLLRRDIFFYKLMDHMIKVCTSLLKSATTSFKSVTSYFPSSFKISNTRNIHSTESRFLSLKMVIHWHRLHQWKYSVSQTSVATGQYRRKFTLIADSNDGSVTLYIATKTFHHYMSNLSSIKVSNIFTDGRLAVA